MIDHEESTDDGATATSADKQARIDREREALLSSLAGADYSAMKTRVAAILNLFPATRNSDTALTLKYWQVFQPEHFDPNGIAPSNLFKLEPQNYIVRARAKIQNEYGLFQADDEIKRNRRKREVEFKEAIVEDAPPRPMTFVYADETGKTHDNVIVASVWVLDSQAVFSLTRAIKRWQEQSSLAKRELHFTRLGKGDSAALSDYLRVISENSQYLSFKIAAVERARTKRPIDEVVAKLHEHLIRLGTSHELESGRIAAPREIEVALDHEQSLDAIAIIEMKERIGAALAARHGDDVSISEIRTYDSRNSPLIQLADLVAGAFNRRLNRQEGRNFKDDFADQVIEKLGLDLQERTVDDLDVSVQFRI